MTNYEFVTNLYELCKSLNLNAECTVFDLVKYGIETVEDFNTYRQVVTYVSHPKYSTSLEVAFEQDEWCITGEYGYYQIGNRYRSLSTLRNVLDLLLKG